MTNISLLTGEDQYSLQAKLRQKKQEHISSVEHSEQSIFHFHSNNLNIQQIQSALLEGGLFASKSLVIISGIPKDTISTNKVKASDAHAVEEFLLKNIERIPQNVTLLLVSYKPDKRTKVYKKISSVANIQEFKPLAGPALVQFIKQQLGSLTDTELSNKIIEIVGTNLFNLYNECDKLKHYCAYNNINKLTNTIITTITYRQSETSSFVILDNIFKDPQKTIKLITQIQQEKIEIMMFLGMMYRGIKLVLQMHDLYQQQIKSSKAIASRLKQNPFAINNQLKNITSINKYHDKIKQLYQSLLNLDNNLKSGNLPVDIFWLEMKLMIMQLNTK